MPVAQALLADVDRRCRRLVGVLLVGDEPNRVTLEFVSEPPCLAGSGRVAGQAAVVWTVAQTDSRDVDVGRARPRQGAGKYRTVLNDIGVYGRPIAEARFVPIAPELIADGMSRWEKYLHGTEPDVLVQLALVHAEFESLHPFLDGNGRLGRILIPLFLFERKRLHVPMFYLSDRLEAHRQTYYDRLLAVSRDGIGKSVSIWILPKPHVGALCRSIPTNSNTVHPFDQMQPSDETGLTQAGWCSRIPARIPSTCH